MRVKVGREVSGVGGKRVGVFRGVLKLDFI